MVTGPGITATLLPECPPSRPQLVLELVRVITSDWDTQTRS